MSKKFFTSDLHFDHKNIIEYCPESRGHFTHIDDMNAAIINNINSKVSNSDQLYILGDIGFCKPEKTMDFLKQMNGEKIIIFGNHDDYLQRSSAFQQQSEIAGVKEHSSYKEEKIKIRVDGGDLMMLFSMMHYPIASFRNGHYGAIHLHGHMHSTKQKRISSKERRILDVGIDGGDFMPYELNEIYNLLKDNYVRNQNLRKTTE